MVTAVPQDARRPRTPRALWFALLAGPVAWLTDESIALLVDANACSGTLHATPGALVRVGLAILGMVSLAAIAAGMIWAARMLSDPRRLGSIAPAVAERIRFLAICALLLGALGAFGVLLRLATSLSAPVCV
jgi:hypothetical protein